MSLLPELAAKFTAHKLRAAEIDALKKDNDTAWDEIEQAMITAMVEEGINSIKLDDGGSFFLAKEMYGSVKADNKPRLFEYLKESGNGSLLKEDVPAQTLKAFLKTHVKELADRYRSEGIEDFNNKAIEFLSAKGITYFEKMKINTRGVGKNDKAE